ncbi:MAG TPA: hypothetical protein VEK57_15560 [Thermoanaerobaculia bacterium]|nr:hypothetical protein [Thermoanaerobaculia bacterium]
MPPEQSFEIIGEIRAVEIIAVGHGIRDLPYLERRFGRGNWRKLKGFATVRLEDGTIAEAEVHWYEAHGIGRRWMKIKRYLD